MMEPSKDKSKQELPCDRRPSIFEILTHRGPPVPGSPTKTTKSSENEEVPVSPSKENVSNRANFFSRLKSFTHISSPGNDSSAKKSLCFGKQPSAGMNTLVLPIIVSSGEGSGEDSDDCTKPESPKKSPIKKKPSPKKSSHSVEKNEGSSEKEKDVISSSRKDKHENDKCSSEHEMQNERHGPRHLDKNGHGPKHLETTKHRHGPSHLNKDRQLPKHLDRHGVHRDKHRSHHKEKQDNSGQTQLKLIDMFSNEKVQMQFKKNHKPSKPKDEQSCENDKQSNHKHKHASDSKHSNPRDKVKKNEKDRRVSLEIKPKNDRESSPKIEKETSKSAKHRIITVEVVQNKPNHTTSKVENKHSSSLGQKLAYSQDISHDNDQKSEKSNGTENVKIGRPVPPLKVSLNKDVQRVKESRSKPVQKKLTKEAVLEHCQNTNSPPQNPPNNIFAHLIDHRTNPTANSGAGKRSERSISSDTTESEYQTVIRLESDEEDNIEPVNIPIESDSEESNVVDKQSVKNDENSSDKSVDNQFSVTAKSGNIFMVRKNYSVGGSNIIKVTKVNASTSSCSFTPIKQRMEDEAKKIGTEKFFYKRRPSKSPLKSPRKTPNKSLAIPDNSPAKTITIIHKREQETSEPKQGVMTPVKVKASPRKSPLRGNKQLSPQKDVKIPTPTKMVTIAPRPTLPKVTKALTPQKVTKPPTPPKVTPASLKTIHIDSVEKGTASATDTPKSDSEGSARRGARVRKPKTFGDDIVLLGYKNLSFFNLLNGSMSGSDSESSAKKSSINRKLLEAKKLDLKSPKKESSAQQKATQLKKKAELISRTKTKNDLSNDKPTKTVTMKKKLSPRKTFFTRKTSPKSVTKPKENQPVKRKRKQSSNYDSDPEFESDDSSGESEREHERDDCVVPQKKGRGRPRKTTYEGDDDYKPVVIGKKKTFGSVYSGDELSDSDTKRPRGRPRKTAYEGDDDYKHVVIGKKNKTFGSVYSGDELSDSEVQPKRRRSSCEQKVKSKGRKSWGEDESKPVHKKHKTTLASYEPIVQDDSKRALTGRPELHEIFSDDLGVGKRARRQTTFFNVRNHEVQLEVPTPTAPSVESGNQSESESDESTSDERFEIGDEFVNPLNVPFSPEIRAYALKEDPFQNRFFLTPGVTDWNDVAQEMPYFEVSYPLILPDFPFILEDCEKCKFNSDFTCKMTFMPGRGVIRCKMDGIVESSNLLNELVSIPLFKENEVLLNGNPVNKNGLHSPSRRSTRLRQKSGRDDDVISHLSGLPDKSPVMEKFFPNLNFDLLKGVVDKLKKGAGASSLNNSEPISELKTPVKIASCSSSIRDNKSPMLDHSYCISSEASRSATPEPGMPGS